MRLVPFAIGMGMVAYAVAVAFYTLLAIWRIHRATKREARRLQAVPNQPPDGRGSGGRNLLAPARPNRLSCWRMYSPTLDEFLKLAAQGNLIPVTRRLLADIETPLSAYRKIRGQGESFLFESVEGGEHLGPLLVRRLQSARRHPADRQPRRSHRKRQGR